jgi:hypothetical protein
VSSPLVTILIAAYKSRADYLHAAVESALAQTWQETEVIVSDDSPDESLRSIVDQFHDARVSYRHNSRRRGVALNHWSCIREARGEYIAVLNHDDLFLPVFLKRLTPLLIDDLGLALAFCDHWVIDADGRRLLEETERVSAAWGRSHLAAGHHRPFFDLLSSQTIPIAMGTVFRRKLLPGDLPVEAGPAYDLWLAYMLCRDGYGAYYVPERLGSWRIHPGSITSQGSLAWARGSAECWRAVSRDERLISIRRIARRKAALAYCSCALAAWRSGRRAGCAWYGLRSLAVLPTLKGLMACLLAGVPMRLARRLTSDWSRQRPLRKGSCEWGGTSPAIQPYR